MAYALQVSIDALQAGDGVFSVQADGDIVLVDLHTGTNRTLVSHFDVKDVSEVFSVPN